MAVTVSVILKKLTCSLMGGCILYFRDSSALPFATLDAASHSLHNLLFTDDSEKMR